MDAQSDSADLPSLSPDTPVPGPRESPPAPSARAGRPAHAPPRSSPDGAGRRASAESPRGDEKDDRAGSGAVPEVVITQADEGRRAAADQPGCGEDGGQPEGGTMSANARGDGGQTNGADSAHCDLQSLRSDSISLSSDAATCGKSNGEPDCQEDDVRSVTTSSVMSLFQRLQLDPLERDWLRAAAVGDVAALRQLLGQDPTLASKKTALHWAAMQGRLEMAEMMARAGVDVNVKSGYTALHLAALHKHPHIIHLLLHTYNAKANIRDYHGKTPGHYWSGSADVLHRPGSQSYGQRSRGRRAQRYPRLPSRLLGSRARSQGHLNLELATAPERHPVSRALPRSPP